MVIFGAGGDLTKRLVVPALYNLVHSGVLPENFALSASATAKVLPNNGATACMAC